MTATGNPNWKLAVGLPSFIFLACILISFSSNFASNNELLSNAILFDLLITAPLAYLFVIRKSRVSNWTAVRIFVAGLVIAGLVINAGSNYILYLVKTWVSPLVDAILLIFLSRKFYIAGKNAKLSGTNPVDFLPYCRMVMHEVTGNEKAGNILSSEIAVLYYAFASKKDKTIDYQKKFSGYRENGIILVLGSILTLFLIETAGVHFLLGLWNRTAAWILTGLSVYTCMQLFAHIRAIRARPIMISSDFLEIHNGLAGDAYIKFENIERIEFSRKWPHHREGMKIALINGLDSHNVIIYLKQPMEVTKIFGIKKSADAVMFFVDRPKEFIFSLQAALTRGNYNT